MAIAMAASSMPARFLLEESRLPMLHLYGRGSLIGKKKIDGVRLNPEPRIGPDSDVTFNLIVSLMQ
jgi:hypothetical protein